jgi:hypothetical protein
MTDARLFRLAKRYKAAKQAQSDGEKDAKTLADKIIPELTRRKVKALESDDVRINKVAGENTQYDIEVMEEVLSPAMFKRCTKRVVDTEALVEQITSGKIKTKDLQKFSKTVAKSPYIIVTLLGDK